MMRSTQAVLALSLVAPSAVAAQVTSRASVNSAGVQANEDSFNASISADDRCVAFASRSDNLAAGDTNTSFDIFVRDLLSGTTELISVDSAGAQANGFSYWTSISADGRFVAFVSEATNLVAVDTNGVRDVFVRDRQSGTTERVNVDSAGTQGNGSCHYPSLSADGRYVAFSGYAGNLVPGDTNGAADVFVRDRQSGTTERVSVTSAGIQANGSSGEYALWMSADGRYVAFNSDASNLVAGDTNGARDVFVHDRQSGTTERVSVDSAGAEGNGFSGSNGVSITADGRYVVFDSSASNLVSGDTNVARDIFVRDRQTGTTERASVDSAGTQGNYHSGWPSISADGRYVAFDSYASNLVLGDTNSARDVFVRDRQSGTTELASVSSTGTQGNADSYPALFSADHRYVVFGSYATNLVAGDTNYRLDVFIRDRAYSPLTSLCDPGAAGVLACPCSNPPGGSGRGCDNSAATGGAMLSASGVAYLSMDTLVFTTSDEKPTATSIVLQGDGLLVNGTAFGQGVRCAGGSLNRMYQKTAVNGSITAPEFATGDPSVSARAAQLGVPLLPGVVHYYLVYYRDPAVLGGCSSLATFNCTQTGSVTYWP